MPQLTLTSTSRHPATPQTSWISAMGYIDFFFINDWFLEAPWRPAVALPRAPLPSKLLVFSEGSLCSSPSLMPLLLLFPPPEIASLVILWHCHLLTSLGLASSFRRDFSPRIYSHPPNCCDVLLLLTPQIISAVRAWTRSSDTSWNLCFLQVKIRPHSTLLHIPLLHKP